MKRYAKLILAFGMMALFCSVADADVVTYTIPLPTTCINDFSQSAGCPQVSNAAFNTTQNNTPTHLYGGDLALSTDTLVDTFSVWAVGYIPTKGATDTTTPASSEWTGLKLYVGAIDPLGPSGSIAEVSASAIQERVYYSGGLNSSGVVRWQSGLLRALEDHVFPG